MSLVDDKYNLLGGPGGFLGQPVDVEKYTPDGLGRYRHYQGGSIYWQHASPLEAFVVYGLIRAKWSQMGWEQSALGFPTSDEKSVGSVIEGGRISFFNQGAILYRPDLGTFETHGAIFRRWQLLGGVNGLGFPLTDELSTPDKRGRFNHFERGSIYWTPQTGAWEVPSDIKDVWASGGWERGPLGYPVAVPSRMPGVFTDFQDFERGTIYTSGPNAKVVVRSRNSVFATDEHFINWANLGETLQDGDIITAVFRQNFPQFGVNITLNAGPRVTWWKAVSLFTPTGGDFKEISTDGARTTATTTVDPSSLDGGNVYLHFKKGKGTGGHYGIYYLGRADRLIGTHVTFNWIKD